MTATDASTTVGGTDPAGDGMRVDDSIDELLTERPPESTDIVSFLGAQFDRGLAWVHFPLGEGGLGLSPRYQRTINERLAAAGAPDAPWRNPIGYGMVAPTIVTWGSAEQKRRYLRPLFTGEEIWCQLFSEPGAGSDFAGLAARGVRDGDEWVVNGQKVWTSIAPVARWGMLVVRTDVESGKHDGLTVLIGDMRARCRRPSAAPTDRHRRVQRGVLPRRVDPATAIVLGDPATVGAWSLTTLMNERVVDRRRRARSGRARRGDLAGRAALAEAQARRALGRRRKRSSATA